ncbi:hypothetical protein CC85DRAFT_239827 [Cutaneotrichosporon oleaginosum]|uniref:Insulin-degrading enzyme n=1 Tax=Cutaneotrichosporon oleaginosum TaxID=879819 RepID=A0A0J0XXP7_9TREE|nr:uncharacterized protein CC85DRAFT_239827 [Cutaneotrichosporon oleaginosum]KLT45842.1 hypothetical protein CC85DRAFT_239827 [Cutaneotrichosporon oleaginosum]TXT06546.1 hypothetical protein COLE_05877 [Cutaneotrichosporon oleaginosum]
MAVPTRALLLAAALALLAWLYRTHDFPPPSVPLWRSANQTPAMTVPIPAIDFPPPPPIPTATGKVDLKLPPTEDREHRYFTLPNGLEVIIVSDPKSDKAAASMDVGVGHLSDPVDLPGCAHFCEHLMFMGTKTFPAENEYSSFLSAHNGQSNAWTAMCNTNYYFDVSPDALEGALDRFSGFFSEPLFSEDCTEREIKAVNSEHQKNLQHDRWRSFQLEKSLSKPGHVYGKFGTGDFKTLWEQPRAAGRDPRQQLIEWWEKEYCARRMKLAVAGREDLDTLEKMVRERFNRVPVRTEGAPPTGPNGVRVTFEDHPYGPEQRGVVTFAKAVRDVRMLEIVVPVPDLSHLAGLKPLNFIGHFVGHEGRGSLLSYLKKQGWCNQLSAGSSHDGNGFSFFKVMMQLTPQGLESWRDVVLAVYKYFELLRSSPPSETAFKEISQLAEISYKYADRGETRDYVTTLSGWMQHPVKREDIVSSNWLLGEWNEELMVKTFQLLDPRQCTVGVLSQQLPKDVTATYDSKEVVYGTEYHSERFTEEFLAEATTGKPNPALHLPGPNAFIPENLHVEKRGDVKQPALRPELLRDNETSRLWYKRDDRFWLPKTNVHMELHNPLMEATPRTAVLTRLLCDAFTDSITEDIYDPMLAELSFHLWYSGDTISLLVGGFSDKLPLLTETMMTKLRNFKVDPDRFDKIVYQAKMQWSNFPLAEPYQVAHYWSSYVTMERTWSPDEKLKELDHITPEDVQAFSRELFQKMYMETLVHGNLGVEDAKRLQDTLEHIISARALSPGEHTSRRTLLLPESSKSVWELPVKNPAEPNSCVVYWMYTGEVTDPAARARLALLGQIVHEPAFNQLRTKEQLGYVAMAQATRSGLRVLVQSERDPVYVETRIESFLTGLKDIIEKMSDEEFDRQRQALIDKKEEQPKNLAEESRRFWSRISDKYYEFGKRATDIAFLRKTTKQEVLDLYLSAIDPASSARRKLSVHLRSQVKPGSKASLNPDAVLVLLNAFQNHGVPVDQAAVGALMESKPAPEQLQALATKAVAAASVSEEAKAELDGLIAALTAKPSGDNSANGAEEPEPQLAPGNIYIDDIHRFRAQLIPSKAAVPLEPLIVSKL